MADEVVIAADSRVGISDLAEYAEVADVLIRLDVGMPMERHLGWLHRQCSGDWIFRIDGDEIASPALVAALPGLVSDPEVRQYWIPRRWLYPDALHALNEPPWWLEYQLRLYRNDSFLRFPGIQHTSAVSEPPEDYVEEPIYHLDLLVNSREARAKKAEHYEILRPGMQAAGGGELNERTYLPESAVSVDLSTVPDEDLREIERVLGALPITDPSAVGEVPLVSLAESDLDLEGQHFDPMAYRGSIVPIERLAPMARGEVRPIHLRITNLGNVGWSFHNPDLPAERQVRLGYRWSNDNGSLEADDRSHAWLRRRVRPGASAIVPLFVRAPNAVGTWTLDVDLLQERWFGCNLEMTVTVVEPSAVTPGDMAAPAELGYDPISFARGGNGVVSLGSGWSTPETWGTWSISHEAIVRFALPKSSLQPLRIAVGYRALPTLNAPPLVVECRLAEQIIGRWEIDTDSHRGELLIDPQPLERPEVLELTFVNFTLQSPEAGRTSDHRQLGIGIEDARILEEVEEKSLLEASEPAPTATAMFPGKHLRAWFRQRLRGKLRVT